MFDSGGSVLSFEMGTAQAAPIAAATANGPAPNGPVQSKTYWYTYDAENRIKINNGALTADGIVLAAGGYQNTYDAAGNVVARVSTLVDQTAPYSGLMETRIDRSDYDLRGNRTVEYHTQVIRGGQMAGNGGVFKRMTYDANNRLTDSSSYYGIGAEYQERLPDGEVRFYEYGGWLHAAEHYEYDVDGRLKLQHAWERITGDGSWVIAASGNNANNRQSTDIGVLSWRGSTHYVATLGDAKATGYDALGRLTTYMVYGMAPDNRQYIHTYTNTYQGWESYQLVSTTGTSNHNSFKPTTNTLSYDALGRLMSQREHTTLRNGSIDDRMRYYAYNGDGAVMQRREGQINSSGQFVQDGPLGPGNYRLIHAAGTQQAELRQGNRLQRNDGSFAYTDQLASLNGLGGYEAGDAASKVMPLAGETLRGLAQRVYGSELMWYLIAEANGLSDPAKELVPGLGLVVPKAVVSRNDSSTFKPYNPGEAIGSTTPDLPYIPPPPKDGCGAFNIIMMTIVAVAVAVATWGALAGMNTILAGAITGATASAASLGVGSMMGAVSFSWRKVAAGAVTGAATAGIAAQWGGVAEVLANSPWKAAALAVTNSVVGAAADKVIANGSFSWKSVAISAGFQLGMSALSNLAARSASKTGGTSSSSPGTSSGDPEIVDSLYNREDALASNSGAARSRYRPVIGEDGSFQGMTDGTATAQKGPLVNLSDSNPAAVSGDVPHSGSTANKSVRVLSDPVSTQIRNYPTITVTSIKPELPPSLSPYISQFMSDMRSRTQARVGPSIVSQLSQHLQAEPPPSGPPVESRSWAVRDNTLGYLREIAGPRGVGHVFIGPLDDYLHLPETLRNMFAARELLTLNGQAQVAGSLVESANKEGWGKFAHRNIKAIGEAQKDVLYGNGEARGKFLFNVSASFGVAERLLAKFGGTSGSILGEASSSTAFAEAGSQPRLAGWSTNSPPRKIGSLNAEFAGGRDRLPSIPYQDRTTLFHYTDEAGLAGILKDEEIWLSHGYRNARFGDGQYFSDIPPEDVVAYYRAALTKQDVADGKLSLQDVSQRFYLNPGKTDKLTRYVEIDVSDLSVRQAVQADGNSIRRNVQLILNDSVMKTTGRVIRHGEVL